MNSELFKGIPPTPARIGSPNWNKDDLLRQLEDFHSVYLRRPIVDNHGGMSSAHLFALWFLLRHLRPKTVIESGVFQGQGTWLIESAVPEAELVCIDIDWSKLKYKSKNAKYLSKDFATLDWSGIDKNKTFVFFDDHMNAVERTFQCAALGFKHIAFEDNYYPSNVGDVYSVKLALAKMGYEPTRDIRYWINRVRGIRHDVPIAANQEDSLKLHKILEIYAELPPVFLPVVSRWGIPYGELPTEAPLLDKPTQDWHHVFVGEAKWYTWLAYLKLKDNA